MKCPFITQLKYCQKLDFEADPITKFHRIIETIFPISKSMKCPFITQLKYCQKFDFEADPITKFHRIIETIFSDFKINEMSFYNAIDILPKIGCRSGPYQ